MRILLIALGLAGCSGEAPPTATRVEGSAGGAPSVAPAAPAASPVAPYVGRWTGVEGMYLVVAEHAGGVTLDMQYDLDNKGRFDGTVTDEGIGFLRNGVAEIARRTDGDATGLKYLAGRTDCLTVKPGEGYCR